MARHCRCFMCAFIFLGLASLVGSGTGEAQEWDQLGLIGQPLTDIAVQNADTIYAATHDYLPTGPGYIFRTTNAGLSWDTLLSSVGTHYLRIDPTNPSILYAGLGSTLGPWGILKTTDGGGSWFHADSGLSNGWIRSLEIHPANSEILYTGTSDSPFEKSTNGGTSWFPIGAGLFNAVEAMVFDPHSPDTMYAGDGPGSGLFKSRDGGVVWEGDILPVSGGVLGLGIDPIDGNVLYVGLGPAGFFRSIDAGETWEKVTGGLPPGSAGSIVVNKITREVFAVTFAAYDGVFKSTDFGVTWQQLEGLPTTVPPFALTISPDQTQLFAGYQNLGVYRTTILVSDVTGNSNQLPSRPALLQNFPNPFNPTTAIRFSIPRSGEISLRIFNLLGEEVATLYSGHKDAGIHTVQWDASGHPSGVYFYRLQTGEIVETRKLALVR